MGALPKGRFVARIEAPHDTVIAAVVPKPDEFPAFMSQLEAVLQEAVESGNWSRNILSPPAN
ncbi:hypothetical protein ACWEO1_22440 [Kitasatospora cineracea]